MFLLHSLFIEQAFDVTQGTCQVENEISMENAEGAVTDDWESCRVKNRTSYTRNQLPNRAKSVWQGDMTVRSSRLYVRSCALVCALVPLNVCSCVLACSQ